MRNLKRALSLALASIMVIGMMVTGAGAVSVNDFSDKDKIVNQEAVSVLTTLGVIAGREDGSYDPTGVVTRGEMAKMLCVVLNGGKDPQLGNITANFADTKGHWAEAYIAYCANLNIIAGKGNGNFEPNATVTGAEAAKMLLVALGYNASVEGYVGANWQINVDVAANQKGLYDGLGTLNTTTGLTRDSAAQMVYNALDVRMVEYSYVITGTPDNSLTTKPQVSSGKLGTLMEEKFNAVKVEGVVVANEFANLDATGAKGASLDEGKTKIAVTNGGTDGDQNTYTGTVTFNTVTGMDELGRSVSLFVKKNNNAAKADVLGSVILTADNKVIVNASADSIATVADDNNLNIASNAQVAQNYGGLMSYSKYTDPKTAGVEKILIDNDGDSDVEIVIMNTYTFGKVTSYVTSGNGSITVSAKGDGLTANKKTDVAGFEDVAKNDYVMAAYIGGKLVVEKADSVTGKLEAYKEKNYTTPTVETRTTKLTVDGTDYNVSHVDGYTQGTDNISAAKKYGSANLDNEGTFYMDKSGYIVAVGDVAENAYNYALVLAKGTTIDERVKVALPDGTTGTYVFKSSGNSIKFNNIVVGQVYGYSINTNKEIRLTSATLTVDNAANAKFTKGKTTVSATGVSDQYANQNTVFFYTPGVVSGAISDVNIYAGYSKAPTLKDNSGATVNVYTNGSRTVAVVFTGTNLTTANVSDNLYVSSVGTSTTNYTNATAFIAGKAEAQSIKMDAKYETGAYTYKVNSDGYYELDQVPNTNVVKSTAGTQYGVFSSNANTMVIGTGANYITNRAEYTILSKTLFVNDSAYLDDPFAELGAGPDQGDKISYVIYNSDKEALLVVVKNTKATDPTTPANMVTTVDSTNNIVNVFNPAKSGPTAVMNAAADALVAAGYTNVSLTGAPADNGVGTAYTNATLTGILNGVSRNITVYRMARLDVNGTTQGYIRTTGTYSVPASANDMIVVMANQNTASKASFANAAKVVTAGSSATTYTFNAAHADDKDIISLVPAVQVTLQNGVAPAKGGFAIANNDYVATGTVLNVTATANNTVYATVDGTKTAVVSGTSTASQTAEYTVRGTKPVTFSMTGTPVSGVTVTLAATGGVLANGVYTAKNTVDSFTVTLSKTTANQGDIVTVTVTPTRNLNEAVQLTLAASGSGTSISGGATVSFASGDGRGTSKSFDAVIGTVNATLTLSDNTTARYVLTVPAGVTASGTTVTKLTDTTYAARGSVTLAGLSTTHYLKADTTYVLSGGTESFNMPGNNLTVTDDKYHMVTVTANVTGGANLNTVTVAAAGTPVSGSYVKEGDTVAIAFTAAGTGTTSGIVKMAMNTVTGLTSAVYTTAVEALANAAAPAAVITADTVTIGSTVATANVTIAYTTSD